MQPANVTVMLQASLMKSLLKAAKADRQFILTEEIDIRRFCGFHLAVLRCVIFEDEHLLAVNKPAGMNTHAPDPFAGEGLYEWLRNREPRWARLAIIHRLDKDTSGVIMFAKTPLANRSLTQQFTQRAVRKRYVFLTDREVREKEFMVES